MKTSKVGRTVLCSATCLCLLALAGCGPAPVNVKGTLVPPAGLELKEMDGVQVAFVSTEEGGGLGAGATTFNYADHTFVAHASDGKGLAPGKYKVAVLFGPYPGSEPADRMATFQALSNQFSTDKTPLTYEVTNDPTQTITVDLTNRTVTKK